MRKRKRLKPRPNVWAGVKFPEGSKRIVFNVWCEQNGNFSATRRKLKKDGLLEAGRVPSLRTIRKWALDNHWDVMRLMIDDGVLDFLEAQEDPDIRAAIRDEGTFFKILEKLRSSIYMRIMEKNSELFPQNATQAVTVLKHVGEAMGDMRGRLDSARERKDQRNGGMPDNITDIASHMAERGELPTQEEVARTAIRIRNEQG